MNTVYSINGPVIKVKDTKDFMMLEMVYVGEKKLIGEVIGITDEFTTIQVYESTTGLKVGEPVYTTGAPLSATLGPGIMSNIFDGIERPLKKLEEQQGAFIDEGASLISIDDNVEYDVTITVRVGDYLNGGDVYAICPETYVVTHYCMLSPLLKGEVIWVNSNGKYKINDVVCRIKTDDNKEVDLTLCQKWPIRNPRPVKRRL